MLYSDKNKTAHLIKSPIQVVTDYPQGTGGRELAPIIGGPFIRFWIIQCKCLPKKAGQDARPSGSCNQSKTSCDRSKVKIYLLNFKSTKIRFSIYYFGRSKIGANNRKRDDWVSDNRKPPVHPTLFRVTR